jgi:polyhydroxyalkanoate synthesis repressor PhaR
MANDKQPTTIKKYANRRLYNTGTSAYVTLEDLAEMLKKGEDFVVYDAKTGEEITRSVLTQIIFEQEGKNGQSLLPIAFLRQLIRFYGDSMQMLVPSYLEFTIDKLTTDQHKFREQFEAALGNSPLAAPTRQMFGSLEEQTRKNMALFNQALTMFAPFGGAARTSESEVAEAAEGGGKADLDTMKRQLDELQKRLEQLVPKE